MFNITSAGNDIIIVIVIKIIPSSKQV